MPIYDVQNHIQRVFIINVESCTKCDRNMSNMASFIGIFYILYMKNTDMLLFMTNIDIAYECRRNFAYKECPYAIAYVTYVHCYKHRLYVTIWRISSICMQCLYLWYTITYRHFSYIKQKVPLYSLPYLTYFDHIFCDFLR